MKLDKCTFAFGYKLQVKGGTPNWATSFGQSKRLEYRINEIDDIHELLKGLIYKSVPLSKISSLLGRPTKIIRGSDEDSPIILGSVFEKIYFNNIRIYGTKFILLVTKDNSESHPGRLRLKYGPQNGYTENNITYTNDEFLKSLKKTLALADNACFFINEISIENQDELKFKGAIVDSEKEKIYPDIETLKKEWDSLSVGYSLNKTWAEILKDSIRKNIIFYGCPGTGKSHAVEKQTEGESVVRTTFHPDSDYSTFVGSYKPTTKQGPRYTSYGEKAVTIKDAGGKELVEDRIVYEFVDQAFLQAYIKAWKFLAEAEEGTLPKKQYLIIEEINRGNCAQIFGDLFQLLDRNDYGFSDYYIHADKDIQKHLASAFDGLAITDSLKEIINFRHKGEDIGAKVLSGEILLLPSNLYIWATMNTSDQSLFPIDSAFKRRWDWKYQPIVKGRDPEGNERNWQIEGNTQNYDWWSFIGKINEIIASTTNSEDKKLGFFFCKAKDGVISAETFVSKVIFYLWNDVFKNFGFDTTIFKDEDGSTLDFDKFYTASITGEATVDKAKVEQFLKNLGVESTKATIEEEENDGDGTSRTSDLSKYTINNSTESWGKNALAAACVQKFVELHPDMPAEEVLNTWKPLSNGIPHFIETEEEHNARTDTSKNRCEEISCGGTLLYVEKNNYTQKNGKIEALINAINEKKWGIRVDKVE